MAGSPTSHFLSAAAFLSVVPSQVTTSTKLELYGLFKYVTVSPTPTSSRPSVFDMTGRAKWDAWISVGKKYTSLEEASDRYIDIAKSLGWSEENNTQHPETQSRLVGSDLPDSNGQIGGSNGHGGMGVSVSTMAVLDEKADENIHGFAVSDNVKALAELFASQPDVDVNALDAFGYTPLHLACDRGNLSAVQLLLRMGADPSIKDSDGLLASELAEIAGHSSVQGYIHSSHSDT